MNLTPDIQDLIERYLHNQLSGQTLLDFEERLATDEELAAEVAFQKDLHLLLADSRENELRKNLELLGEQVVLPKKKEDKGWLAWLFPADGGGNLLDWLVGQPQRNLAWLLPLVLVAGWWLMAPDEPMDPIDPIVDNDTLKVAPKEIPVDTAILNPIVEEDNEAIFDTHQQKNTPNPILKLELPTPKTIKEPYVQEEGTQPIPPNKKEIKSPTPEELPLEQMVQVVEDTAIIPLSDPPTYAEQVGEMMSSIPSSPTEYDTHPILHQMIIDADNSFKIEPDTFIFDFSIATETAPTKFYFSGKIEQKKKVAKKGLQFYLFSNQAEDYETFKPIATLSLKGQKLSKGNYQYLIQQSFELAPATYYFVIRPPKSEDNYYIGYFSVILDQ